MKKVTSDVYVYHDETTDAGESNLKGHVFFFVPKKVVVERDETFFSDGVLSASSLERLYEQVKAIREDKDLIRKLHFTEISGNEWGPSAQAQRDILELAVDSLRHKNVKKLNTPHHSKLAIILYKHPKDSSLALYGGERKEKLLKYDETLMRFLLKGALHYLYDKDTQVRLLRIVSDGEPNHRKISEERVINRLVEEQILNKGLRDYVKISDDVEIVHQSSQHKDFEQGTKERLNANMLQIADMLLGSVLYHCLNKNLSTSEKLPRYGTKVDDKKGVISYPVRKMINKRKRGSNFKYSGHYKSFSLSEAEIKNNEWQFDSIKANEILKEDPNQTKLLEDWG